MLPTALLVLASSAFGQQEDVTRYAQVRFRPRTWDSVGFDYSLSTGDLTLTPDLLTGSLQQQLGAVLAQLAAGGRLPQGYALVVPTHSVTQTFAVGPQLAFRHWRHWTVFVRPVFAGAIREAATQQPRDPIAAEIAMQLAPTGKKTDIAPFIGFGGGYDILFTKHFALRTQADLEYDHLFNDLLRDGRFTVRFSIGPAFNFGKNIVQ